jgi:hypothetical protein
MNKNQMEELIAKYNEGLADPSEILHLERLIESGEVDLTRLRELARFDETIERLKEPVPSKNLDRKFYDLLSKETSKANRFDFSSWFTLQSWIPKLAVTMILIVIGFIGGTVLQKNSGGGEVKELAQEVSGLKEMMMISMLEKESATDRLKAVSLSEEIQGPSKKVTEALFKTLNADPSVNVRLAALDALHNYAKSPLVREELVRSIAQQESPLVQVALAELMVTLQEKSSVKELRKILGQKSTPREVKQRIEESIKVLI